MLHHRWPKIGELPVTELLPKVQTAVSPTLRGCEPVRAETNAFRVHHLGHSVTASCVTRTYRRIRSAASVRTPSDHMFDHENTIAIKVCLIQLVTASVRPCQSKLIMLPDPISRFGAKVWLMTLVQTTRREKHMVHHLGRNALPYSVLSSSSLLVASFAATFTSGNALKIHLHFSVRI